MASRQELGVSHQEYEDAVNLEKVYTLVARHSKCSTCNKRKPTHVDPDSVALLCASCARGTSGCKEIGVDRLRTADVKKLERKYKKESGSSKAQLRPPRRDRGRARHVKTPSVSEESETESTSESEEEPPPRRRSKSPGRSPSHHHSHRSTSRAAASGYDGFNSFQDANAFDSTNAMNSVPGMRGLLMNAAKMNNPNGMEAFQPFGSTPQMFMQQPKLPQQPMLQQPMGQPFFSNPSTMAQPLSNLSQTQRMADLRSAVLQQPNYPFQSVQMNPVTWPQQQSYAMTAKPQAPQLYSYNNQLAMQRMQTMVPPAFQPMGTPSPNYPQTGGAGTTMAFANNRMGMMPQRGMMAPQQGPLAPTNPFHPVASRNPFTTS